MPDLELHLLSHEENEKICHPWHQIHPFFHPSDGNERGQIGSIISEVICIVKQTTQSIIESGDPPMHAVKQSIQSNYTLGAVKQSIQHIVGSRDPPLCAVERIGIIFNQFVKLLSHHWHAASQCP
jgi:hypothetical protein